MRYAQIRKMDISNGEGVGVALFVQGCHFHCKGCFNKETWDFCGGKEWTPSIEEQFFKLIERPYIKRVSFLGGEPLANENVWTVLDLILKIKDRFPQKKIWLYTGYKFDDAFSLPPAAEKIMTARTARLVCLRLTDIVVDGRFELDKQDLLHKEIIWAGSTNQRIIDVKKSLESDKVVEYGA